EPTEPPSDPTTEPTAAETTSDPTTEPTTALAPAAWTARPGYGQVTVLGAAPGETLALVTAGGDDVAVGEVADEGTVDELGSLLFRDVEPGLYTVQSETATSGRGMKVAAVDDPPPPPSFYTGQQLPAGGFGYLQTRDGTTLSINVVLPGPPEGGPYPTVVEYSGYDPSNPDAFGFSQLFPALGYAYVGVNMRGSGCSGGSWRFFEDAQLLDGYDAIEAIAAQPWVRNNRVGMVGVSYPGISQLFVAAQQPPSLAAITPLSVIDDSYRSVLYPGGILNTGFAVEWIQQRLDDTAPEGQAWTTDRITAGDMQCADNQRLRLQNDDLVAEIRDNPYWTDTLGDPLAPRTFVDQIEVPVYLAGAWQDEQTGGHFATMLDQFTGTEHFYATLTNGLHTESVGAASFARLVEFLDLYVAERTPSLAVARVAAPILAGSIFGTDQITLPPDRFEGQTYEQALATFEAEPPIQILFEEGAADGALPGAPMPRFTEVFESWPPPSTTATSWFLGPDSLSTEAPTGAAGATSYTANPDALPSTFFGGEGSEIWRTDVAWQWQEPPEGTAASFVSPALDAETVMVGSASADLWIRTDADDTDLEVTLSEIRPDGQEVYVQSGWLRASLRALDDAESTELQPVHTFLEDDAEPLVAGEWTPVRVEIHPFAHAFRPGSRLRVTIDAPGNSRGEWELETIAAGETVEIGFGPDQPSQVVLPVIAGIDVPDALPTCTLRGQPCRTAPVIEPGS
ncbi:MAG: CocE/NonD family hydrolase, partial [Ilumatobacteraceae bacterium]